MRLVVALLAAVLALALAACEEDGAEPGASREATLVLDFTPNAVHAGIYSADSQGDLDAEGVELTIREPGASTDAPKILAAGRADFAVLDIHDLALARERGARILGVLPLVRRPLASVIARNRSLARRPADLAGGRIGVSGLPSDNAVLDAVINGDGADPESVERVTVGFDAVAALAAGRLDAATAFWNAEGIALERQGVPVRVFRVDDFGAPRYPELVLVTSARTLERDPALVDSVRSALEAGYRRATSDPPAALADLLNAVPELDEGEQAAQLDALTKARALDPAIAISDELLREWADWDLRNGIVAEPIDVTEAFALPHLERTSSPG